MLRMKPATMLRSSEIIFQERGQYEEQSPEMASVNSFPSYGQAPPTIQRQSSFPSLVDAKMCPFQVALVVKSPPAITRDASSIPGSGRYPGDGNGYPLQYSCLENSMDRGAWWATFHGDLKESDTTEWLTLSHFDTRTFNIGSVLLHFRYIMHCC